MSTIPPTAYSRTRKHPVDLLQESLRDASATPFWLDSPDRPQPNSALVADTTADFATLVKSVC